MQTPFPLLETPSGAESAAFPQLNPFQPRESVPPPQAPAKLACPFPEYQPPPQPEAVPDLEAIRAEAEAIRLKALQEAERIREQARREGYQQGYEQGYLDGERDAHQQAHQELQRTIEQLRAQVAQVIEAAQARCTAYLSEAESQMVALALEAVRKVVREEVRMQPEHVVAIVREVLRRLPPSGHVRVRVNPLDLETVRAQRNTLLQVIEGIEGIEIVEDRRVEQGGCIVETEQGVYDARIRTQLAEIERAIKEAA